MSGMPPQMGAARGTVASFDAESYLEETIYERLRRGELSSRRVLLENGIEVLLIPDAASRLVTSIVVVRGGSALETPGISGASHFLEHMLFNGTERRTQKQLYEEVDYYAGFNNAFTRRTHAAFMLTVPSAYLGRGLDIQSDMLLHSTIPPEKFEKERGIILEELAKDIDNEQYQLERVLRAETYPASSYGLPVLGTAQSIAEMNREDVWAFYRRYYVPQRLMVVLLGGFDPRSALDSLNATLGAAPLGEMPYSQPVPPATIRSTRTACHTLPLSRSRARMVWNGPRPGTPAHASMEALIELLMGGDASPLARELAQRFPGQIQSWSAGLESGYGFSRVILDVDLGSGAPLHSFRDEVIEALASAAPPAPQALDGLRVALHAAERAARQRSFMYAPLVTEDLALGGTAGLQTRLVRMDALATEDLVRSLEVLAASPAWSILVDANALHDSGIGGEPKVSAEESATLPYEVEVQTLDNGAHLLHLPAQSSGLLSVYLLIDGRNYLEPAGQEGVTELLHQILALGPRSMDETEFEQALRAIGGRFQSADRAFLPFDDYYTAADFSFVRFQALEEHSAEALDLVAEILREPRWDPEALERLRGVALARISRESGSARTVAREELRALIYGEGHPEVRSPYGSVASVAAITLADLQEHYDRLLDPRRVWIAVASNLSRKEIRLWAEELLSGCDASSPTRGMAPERYALWNARKAAAAGAADRWRAIGGRLDLPAGGERGYVLEAALLPGEFLGDSSALLDEETAARVAGEMLSARVTFRLREEEGRAYGIGASVHRSGGRLVYVARAGTRPENIEAMATGFRQVREAARRSFDPQEAQRAAHTLYGSFLRRQESRLNQAMNAVWSARAGRQPLDWWLRAEQLTAPDHGAVERMLAAIAAAETALVITAR